MGGKTTEVLERLPLNVEALKSCRSELRHENCFSAQSFLT